MQVFLRGVEAAEREEDRPGDGIDQKDRRGDIVYAGIRRRTQPACSRLLVGKAANAAAVSLAQIFRYTGETRQREHELRSSPQNGLKSPTQIYTAPLASIFT